MLPDAPPQLLLPQIEQHLHALASPDASLRTSAFNALKSVDKEALSLAWQNTRGLLPIHGGQLDCFGRVEVVSAPIVLGRAIVTVISPGFEPLLGHLLHSLERVGNTVPVVVFCLDESYENLEKWDGIIRVRCHSRERLDASVKGVIYSCARWVKARHIIALEADMLALGSLDPLWTALEQMMRGTIAGCRPQAFIERVNTLQWVLSDERQEQTALPWLGDELFWFNGGLLAGGSEAWQQLDALLTGLGVYAFIFLDGAMKRTYAEEILMNWAVNRMMRFELNPGWNVQFFTKTRDTWITTLDEGPKRRYECHAFPARILHFLGPSRTGEGNLLEGFLRELGYTAQTSSPSPSAYTRCQICHVTKSCGSCFEPSSYAANRLSNGMRSAICRNCFAQKNNLPVEEIPLDLRMELEAK